MFTEAKNSTTSEQSSSTFTVGAGFWAGYS